MTTEQRAALAELGGSPVALDPARVEALAAGQYAGPRDRGQERRGGVAVVRIFGLLMPHSSSFALRLFGGTPMDALRATLRALSRDRGVSSIVLQLDTPGGSVHGIEETARLMREIGDRTRVVAVLDPLAASGGFWLAASADEVVVSPSGQGGGVGVYALHFDHSEQLTSAGVKVTVIRSGSRKAEGTRFEPLSDPARAHRQSLVDAYGQMFERSVAEGRGVSTAEVREHFGQGRTFEARRLVSLGMADRIATLEDVVDDLRSGRSRAPRRRGSSASAVTPKAAGPALSWTEAFAGADEAERADVRRTCLHEAGHAVALVARGWTVVSAGLRWSVADGRFRADGGYVVRDSRRGHEVDEVDEVIAAAGFAALVHAGLADAAALAGAAGDFERVRRLQLQSGGTLAPGRAVAQARAFLRPRWGAVQRLAAALEREGQLSGPAATLEVLAELPDSDRWALGVRPRAS